MLGMHDGQHATINTKRTLSLTLAPRSVGAMVEAARGTGLQLRETNDIGPHYAVTLREWRQAWEDKRQDVLRLGYSDRFWRKYRCGLGGEGGLGIRELSPGRWVG